MTDLNSTSFSPIEYGLQTIAVKTSCGDVDWLVFSYEGFEGRFAFLYAYHLCKDFKSFARVSRAGFGCIPIRFAKAYDYHLVVIGNRYIQLILSFFHQPIISTKEDEEKEECTQPRTLTIGLATFHYDVLDSSNNLDLKIGAPFYLSNVTYDDEVGPPINDIVGVFFARKAWLASLID